MPELNVLQLSWDGRIETRRARTPRKAKRRRAAQRMAGDSRDHLPNRPLPATGTAHTARVVSVGVTATTDALGRATSVQCATPTAVTATH